MTAIEQLQRDDAVRAARIQQGEWDRVTACKSLAEWNTLCDEIKVAHGGEYPSDWKKQVLDAGMHLRFEPRDAV